ncbi:hypothetical protein [Niabella hibiscisoli]|uniref:hypothetical protein n=1 Tax=Niabella hibiscisoli TaxID=1825928 RepID=UPI001F0F62C0|nr:hypothetical protein [Niabella hibiscisoli]MCH5716571.1 hypothetical protein [Niabella hibiscisoli]
MSRCVFNEATDEEMQQLQQLLNDDPGLQQQYDLISQVFKNASAPNLPDPYNYELQALSLLDKAEKMEALAGPETVIRPIKK